MGEAGEADGGLADAAGETRDVDDGRIGTGGAVVGDGNGGGTGEAGGGRSGESKGDVGAVTDVIILNCRVATTVGPALVAARKLKLRAAEGPP